MDSPHRSTSTTALEANHRATFTRADTSDSYPISLSAFWQRLSSGHSRILDHFYSPRRSYVVVENRAVRARRPSARGLAIAEAAFLGSPLKLVALEDDIAESTVSAVLSTALQAIGAGARVTAAPMLCAMAAHEHRGLIQATDARAALVDDLEVVSVERPDLWLQGRLAPAELDVARLCMEGNPYTAIAGVRDTSVRTVANQLASIFRKFHLSGRSELLCLTIRESSKARTPAVFPTQARSVIGW